MALPWLPAVQAPTLLIVGGLDAPVLGRNEDAYRRLTTDKVVPLAPRDTIAKLRGQCSRLECLLTPSDFAAISHFYHDFQQVEHDEVVRLLREARVKERS